MSCEHFKMFTGQGYTGVLKFLHSQHGRPLKLKLKHIRLPFNTATTNH